MVEGAGLLPLLSGILMRPSMALILALALDFPDASACRPSRSFLLKVSFGLCLITPTCADAVWAALARARISAYEPFFGAALLDAVAGMGVALGALAVPPYLPALDAAGVLVDETFGGRLVVGVFLGVVGGNSASRLGSLLYGPGNCSCAFRFCP